MNKYSNPVALMKKFLVYTLVALMAAGLFPVDAYAAFNGGSFSDEVKGLTVTWYNAARFDSNRMSSLFGNIDSNKSEAAYRSFDRSIVLRTDKISNLSDIDMSIANTNILTDKNRYIWGEVTGYFKMPDGHEVLDVPGFMDYLLYCDPTDGNLNYILEVDGVTLHDNWIASNDNLGQTFSVFTENVTDTLMGTNNAYLMRNEYHSFRLRIAKNSRIIVKKGATVNLLYTWYDPRGKGNVFKSAVLPDQCFFSEIAFINMKQIFRLDPRNYTINFDQASNSRFPVGNYEYGYCDLSGNPATETYEVMNAKDFKPLVFGINQLDRGIGSVVIKDKFSWMNSYLVIGKLWTDPVNNLTVTKRTPATTTLSWSPPASGETPTGYDIYRKTVGAVSGFSFNPTVSGDMEPKLIGSASDLTYTDQAAAYDGIYEYYVKARYNTGASDLSKAVRSDSVTMEGIASTPINLKVKGQTQDTVTLSWNESESVTGVKEYIIYRNLTHHQTDQTPSTSSTGGVVIIGDMTLTGATERGRSGSASFTDAGLVMGDEAKYYVQAVDYNGIPSFISSPVAISVPDLTKPTKPGNLQVGDVLRYGNQVEYDYPKDTVVRNAVLGPEREVALQWEPSSDNVGVAGYNIYRSASGQASSPGMSSSQKEKPICTTKDTFFVDKGLNYGAEYFYSVEAVDVNGFKSDRSEVVIGTEKSGLASLKILNGSGGYLYPDPLFKCYQTDYQLDVGNGVKEIVLMPGKLDSQATVKINGTDAKNSAGNGPYALEPGENNFTIEVVPRPASTFNVSPETTTYTLTVNRANITSLPALTLPEILAVAKEGDLFMASGKLEVKDGLPWTGIADYGDGSGEQPLKLNPDGSFDLEHRYFDNGTYQIKVDFRYKDLGLVTGTLKAVVENVAPSLTGGGISAEYTLAEGSLLTFGGIIADPGHDSWTANGKYGGKSVAAEVDQEKKTFSFREIFYDLQSVYDMILEIMDDDGGLFTKHIKVNVLNVMPAFEGVEPIIAQKGVEFTRIVSFTDPGQDNWTATVDYVSRPFMAQPVTVNKDRTIELKNTYQYNGNYNIYISLSDGGGKASTVSIPVKVKDLVVAVDAGKDISVPEGQSFEKSIQLSGPAYFFKKITVDYGDGTKEQELSFPRQAVEIAQRYTVNASLQHSYADNGTYTITVTATDIDGDVCRDSFKAEVSNVSPEVRMTRMKGDRLTGVELTGSGSIIDPGTDTWTAEIDYGDGSKESVKVDSGGTFNFSHSYGSPGLYVVTAWVQDDDGGTGGDSQKVVVNRPKANSSEVSSDASLHSLTTAFNLIQLPGGSSGFTPSCLNYDTDGSMGATTITVTADTGATIQYKNGGSTLTLTQGTATTIDLVAADCYIYVTAEDGVTTKTYKITY